MYAKLVENQLQIAGNIIKGNDETGYYCIANPTEEQLIQKGYKLLVEEPEPEYDKEEQRVVKTYTETEEQITAVYTIEPLTDEEHNEVIQQEINEEENKMTLRNIRNAALGDSYAIGKLQEIENNIATLRAKLRETEKGE